MTRWNKFFFLIFLCSACISPQTKPLDFKDFQPKNVINENSDDIVFPISNELQTYKILPILHQSPTGIIFSVGGEKSFKLASMHPSATGLFIVDRSYKVIRFSQINLKLLHAETLKEYRLLRWYSTLADWATFSKKHNISLTQSDFNFWQENVRDLNKSPYPFPEMLNQYGHDLYYQKIVTTRSKLLDFWYFLQKKRDSSKTIRSQKEFLYQKKFQTLQQTAAQYAYPLTLTKQEFDWWHEHYVSSDFSCFRDWQNDFANAVDMASFVNFKSENYLFDETLYDRLHNLAIQNKIAIIQLDLNDSLQLSRFVQQVAVKKLFFSVIDLDNLYHESYLGDKRYRAILKRLLRLTKPESVLLTMANYKRYACGLFQIYIGFRMNHVRLWPNSFTLGQYLNSLPNSILDLIDGHLYELNQLPPYYSTWSIYPPSDPFSR